MGVGVSEQISSKHAAYGLFWFNSDYSKVYICEEEGFDQRDLADGVFKMPGKAHLDFNSKALKVKRGRVVLEAGRVVIYVGLQCPGDDPMEYSESKTDLKGTDLVIRQFNLEEFKYNIFIRKDEHWNGEIGYDEV